MSRVIVITGGARGIGKKLVENFASNGDIVAFSYNTSVDRAISF